eukprot:9850-Heterococcus_DN1.PRE.1
MFSREHENDVVALHLLQVTHGSASVLQSSSALLLLCANLREDRQAAPTSRTLPVQTAAVAAIARLIAAIRSLSALSRLWRIAAIGTQLAAHASVLLALRNNSN